MGKSVVYEDSSLQKSPNISNKRKKSKEILVDSLKTDMQWYMKYQSSNRVIMPVGLFVSGVMVTEVFCPFIGFVLYTVEDLMFTALYCKCPRQHRKGEFPCK